MLLYLRSWATQKMPDMKVSTQDSISDIKNETFYNIILWHQQYLYNDSWWTGSVFFYIDIQYFGKHLKL